MAEISIESWRRFISNNKEISAIIERGATDLADMTTNVETMSKVPESINSSLDSLKKVKVSSRLYTGTSLKTSLTNLVNEYKDSSCKVIGVLSYAEANIKKYNFQKDAGLFLNDIMQGTSDVGAYWVTLALTKNTPLSAFSYLLTYGTDARYEGGDFVIGDGTSALTKKILETTSLLDNSAWINTATGTAAVFMYNGFKDYLTDKGLFTDNDVKRLVADTLGHAANYLTWVTISDIIATSAASGGMAAGPAGAVGAGVASFVVLGTNMAYHQVKDDWTGDVLVDEFKRNGITYEIPRNGSGKDRTYDVLFEKYEKKLKNYEIDGKEYSESNYKKTLYNKWEDVYDANAYTPKEKEDFNAILKQYREAKTVREANDIKMQIKGKYSSEYKGGGSTTIYDCLEAKDFDLDEYYLHYHPEIAKGTVAGFHKID